MNDRRNHHERSMSEPRHIYFSTVTAVFQPHIHPKERDNDVRFTQTSGPEWGALMERARKAVDPLPTLEQVNTMDNAAFDAVAEAVSLVVVRQTLRDLLAYFGEQP